MMDPARWDRVQDLFHRAAGRSEPERHAFLQEACGGDRELLAAVQAMLEEDSRASLLDRDVVQVANHVFGDSLSASFKEFSPYRIKEVLGEGGMGVVYLAERKDLGNLVAIKILRDAWLSPARRERFAAEQRTLAQLNHPSIARLYDANTLPDGTPWFVMEYVDGVPLTAYCRRNNSSVEDRLKLLLAVCDAVEYAHGNGIIHRDLKPSNILVKQDGSPRLLDFGIAKQLDPAGRPVDLTRTDFRPMTPAYASPEQLRGEQAGAQTDVYSLGVILYELLTGRLPFEISHKNASEAAAILQTGEPPRPSAVAPRSGGKAPWADLDVLCLTAMHRDPQRRYPSVEALARDIDRCLNREPLAARPDSLRYTAASLARRNAGKMSAAMAVLALLAAAVVVTLNVSRKAAPLPRQRSVAVLPFQNADTDHSLDFLSLALGDEIATTLGYARSLSVRPFESTSKYAGAGQDPLQAARDLHVTDVVTGHFLKAGEQLQIVLETTDVKTKRMLWRDVLDVPVQNMVAMQAQIAAKTRRGLAPVLGVSEFVTDNLPKPRNEQAYDLYLRGKAASGDREPNKLAMEMLEKSVALDPEYAPAWEILATKYGADGWFGNGGEAMLERWYDALERAAALDPDNVIFRAGEFYIGATTGRQIGKSLMTRGEAYRGLEGLVRRRPDSARLHFVVSWILRDAGLLEEAARECDIAVLLDAQDAGARSCAVAFMFLGDYRRALDYLHLDPGSEFEKAISMDILLRQGKEKEALEARPHTVPAWAGYDMLVAFLEHRPAREIAALAGAVKPSLDPEINYFSTAHLAYCGQTGPASAMLKRAIAAGYCSYPAIDSDPLLASLRAIPEFKEIRSAALACQNAFLAER